jgi:hypothetical protein
MHSPGEVPSMPPPSRTMCLAGPSRWDFGSTFPALTLGRKPSAPHPPYPAGPRGRSQKNTPHTTPTEDLR